ncbi:hypothetical protein GGS20DRAFT_576820 [Poronia punctata]|nr:hypothetical protein GGS20DRAFT_576820 [Poronia punctata]
MATRAPRSCLSCLRCPVPDRPSSYPTTGTSATVAPFEHFSATEINILAHAAAILNCSVTQLYNLDNRRAALQHLSNESHTHAHAQNPTHANGHTRLRASPTSYNISTKRPRLSTDLAAMPSHEKPPPISVPAPVPVPVPVDEDDSSQQGASLHGFPLGIGSSRFTQCLPTLSMCSPCMTCEPQGYGSVPATSSYDYEPQPYLGSKPHLSSVHSMPSTLSQSQPSLFEANGAMVTHQMFPGYPVLQPDRPLTVQPTTSGQGMVYPGPVSVPSEGYIGFSGGLQSSSPVSPSNHIMRAHGPQPHMHTEMDHVHVPGQSRAVDIIQAQQRPIPAKRGPFRNQNDRERTAETRRIGSCIRCRMQRIRCDANPDDKSGACLTCQRVSNVKVWRMPCLRYKITDVRLFKPGPVKGHEWTRRWMEGVADDISHWASTETKRVRVTEGYTEYPVELRVREFVPQEGDSLHRSWVHEGEKKKVLIPAYAIVNLEEAKGAYSTYISRSLPECCKSVLSGKDKLLVGTYWAALKAVRDPACDEKERDLLKKALQLWMAVRLTTKSTVIVGDETLGMSPDIMDETSPLQGKIPLPPVMGAQIELVLIHQIQSNLRREMLESLQSMTQANKQQTWFTTYLITFILLHNVALLCQHDAGYARKHGMQTRFAREEMVREYQMGANILLAYFHYCNKGIYPFSAECKEQDLITLAALDEQKTQFIRQTKWHVQRHRKSWAKLRQSNDYENDFYYISQLFEENWMPQSTI